MASMAAELFKALSKYPYEPVLRMIPPESKCNKSVLEAERKVEAGNYKIDTAKCVNKGGKLNANGLFEIFTKYSHKSASETRSDLIDLANENSKKLNKYAVFTLRKRGKTVANWLNEIRLESTPGDEIAIYCLSNMYLRHVYVKTSKLFWTTVKHTWEDDDASIRSKCEVFLMYLGTGNFGEYIPVVTTDRNILTLDDLSINKSKSKPTKTTSTMATPGKRPKNPNRNRPVRSDRKKIDETLNDLNSNKHITRNKHRVNYADLNLGIDSNDESPPPRKCKKSIAATLREPSQTVIAARNQRITRKSLQSSEYERTKLIGTVIITPPAKEIKEEHKDNVIKTEKEWLNLPKNVPTENISLNDPNVHPRLIRKDGSICHSKTYWKSLNKKPPLKEFELPDLFSDDEGPGTENNDKGELITNTMVSTRKTRMTSCEPEEASVTDKSTYNKKTPNKNIKTGLPSTQGNEFANGVPSRVNTEKTKAADRTEPLSIQTNPSKETQTSTSNIARTDMVTSNETNTLTGTNTTDINTETAKVTKDPSAGSSIIVTESPVNTDNNSDYNTPTPDRPNTKNIAEPGNAKNVTDTVVLKGKGTSAPETTVNTEKIDDDEIPQGNDTAVTESNVNTEKIDDNETPKENDTRTQEANVNTETTNGKQQISDTPKSTNLIEDWASLMFHSDDSLFDEMTKQFEDRTDKVEPITCKPASTATQEAEILPDIVLTQSKTDAATGLLMLSLNPSRDGC